MLLQRCRRLFQLHRTHLLKSAKLGTKDECHLTCQPIRKFLTYLFKNYLRPVSSPVIFKFVNTGFKSNLASSVVEFNAFLLVLFLNTKYSSLQAWGYWICQHMRLQVFFNYWWVRFFWLELKVSLVFSIWWIQVFFKVTCCP